MFDRKPRSCIREFIGSVCCVSAPGPQRSREAPRPGQQPRSSIPPIAGSAGGHAARVFASEVDSPAFPAPVIRAQLRD
jgi:hypothetical protein